MIVNRHSVVPGLLFVLLVVEQLAPASAMAGSRTVANARADLGRPVATVNGGHALPTPIGPFLRGRTVPQAHRQQRAYAPIEPARRTMSWTLSRTRPVPGTPGGSLSRGSAASRSRVSIHHRRQSDRGVPRSPSARVVAQARPSRMVRIVGSGCHAGPVSIQASHEPAPHRRYRAHRAIADARAARTGKRPPSRLAFRVLLVSHPCSEGRGASFGALFSDIGGAT